MLNKCINCRKFFTCKEASPVIKNCNKFDEQYCEVHYIKTEKRDKR